ncbi:MAG TPA: hypothetical protein VGD45_12250 [Steroidobacter sp.]|uniref:hypothetical protein n=1 Tax=Steroidobacter sp. TaxID=1978227 RepID=UPI002EDA5E1A
MEGFKARLLDALSASGWELVARTDGADWWLEESWLVRSAKQRWGYELHIMFLVDPSTETNQQTRLLSAIAAFEQPPAQRPVGAGGVAVMDLLKGNFDDKLAAFVAAIDAHRNEGANS